jgi:hypothetical protein
MIGEWLAPLVLRSLTVGWGTCRKIDYLELLLI